MSSYYKYAPEVAKYCEQKIKDCKSHKEEWRKEFGIGYARNRQTQVWFTDQQWAWRSTDIDVREHMLKGFVAAKIAELEEGTSESITTGSLKYVRSKKALVGTVNKSKRYSAKVSFTFRVLEPIVAEKVQIRIFLNGRNKIDVNSTITITNGFKDDTAEKAMTERIRAEVVAGVSKALAKCKGKLSHQTLSFTLEGDLTSEDNFFKTSLDLITYESIRNVPVNFSLKKTKKDVTSSKPEPVL